MDVVLSLDLSTTSTGWSLFSFKDKKLLDYGFIKPKVKGVSKLMYPKKQLEICRSVAKQILTMINDIEEDGKEIVHIVIEEINRHKNRMAGKTLDALHAILWDYIDPFIHLVYYMDSDGAAGWRSKKGLNLIMSDADRQHNKEAKKLNKSMAKGTKKIPIINKKHLACRFVNQVYGTDFDVDERATDADICDSIGLGHVFLMYKNPN